MVNNHYKTAIIGLDAQFENQQSMQTDIDRVERALYLGKSTSTANKTLNLSCSAAIERMARANQVNSADIKVVVIKHDADNTAIDIEQAIVVSSLASALQQIEVLIEQSCLVALLGINLLSLSDKQNSSDDCHELATISYDQNFSAYQACRGIAALLFAPATFAQTHHCYVYSRVRAFATGSDIASVTAAALDKAQVNATDVGLLEVSALSNKETSFAEMQGLVSHYSYKNSASDGANEALNTAISCARSVTGEGAGFSEVLGLLRSVIALQQRYIPAITDWQQPVSSELAKWQNSSCYFPTEARPWYPQPNGNAHLGAYSCLSNSVDNAAVNSADNSAGHLAGNYDYCHIILEEEQVALVDGKHAIEDIRNNGFIACSDLQLVLIGANDLPNLLTKLTDLENEVEQSEITLNDIALTHFEQSKADSSRYTIALLCESIEELAKEIKLAKAGVPVAFSAVKSDNNNQQEWRTPKGSYFTASPVNDIESFTHSGKDSISTHNVSFLYPGIGATYVGLGRDLFHLFPEIHQDVANLADDIGASLKDTLLNPRSIIRPDFKALKQLDLNLRGSLADIAEAGVGFACVFTKVFENVFKVKADFATGYSMGEVSMYAALGAWQQPGLMSARLANSDTFNQRLCGDLLTLREHWGLAEPSQTDDELIWETYTIKATLAEVIAASEGEERVYCTIVNTPDSLLLGGYPADCLRVIKKLGVRAMPLNMANAIHSAPAKIEYDDMVELYTMDVTERLKTKMYSSSCYLPVPQMSKAIAHSVAKCLCDQVDFPRLINTMHDKGARVFIEMGPGRSLCSWVDKILDFEESSNNDFSNKEPNQEPNQEPNKEPSEAVHKARVSVPVNAKGTSDELTYVRAVAKLISHGVKLDLHRLFSGSIIVHKT
ncbi:PfaB family protein [Colwellia psychrerythraea]|uniref:PfaB family protein n=1 Tax=Colwellia psychrerythraea TaxID=28229 RepID=A0A099KFZ4_COLPS|nr:PfaB family protein [Colwellia psychrerythraea]KGJ89674.1 PfaB family protein [Colwellia psychrerythraea]